jgi:hypothetical protein
MPDHHLVCKMQRLDDGRLRERNLLLSEKMFAGELTHDAANRAVFEELQVDPDTILFVPASLVTWNEVEESRSYPTLKTQYQLHQMTVVVPGLPTTQFSTIEGEGEHFWEWERDSADDKRYKEDSALVDDQAQSSARTCFGCRSPVML